MFGVLKTSGEGWNCRLRNEWAGHLCSTCLALGQVGQPARLAANYDAALISALTDAQTTEPTPRIRHVCALRGFRHAQVPTPSAAGAQYAAALSTLMVATRVDDHIADGDGWMARLPTFWRALARRAREASRHIARRMGFDLREIETVVAEQSEREAQAGRDFLFYSGPTERAVSAAFAETAELADKPQNRQVLAELGALFGRLMLLFDSYRDLDEDRAGGHFNALSAATSGDQVKSLAQRLFSDASQRIRELVPRLVLERPQLVEHLLITELDSVGRRTLDMAALQRGGAEESAKRKREESVDSGCSVCCCDGCQCAMCAEGGGGTVAGCEACNCCGAGSFSLCEVCVCAECCSCASC